MPIRTAFPKEPGEYQGGMTDGYCFSTEFAGGNLERSYAMVKQFLKEEGYGDLPLPSDVHELKQFRWPARNRQILMFEDNGYVHNPIKVLFPRGSGRTGRLRLEIYDESEPGHLLRFHKKLIV